MSTGGDSNSKGALERAFPFAVSRAKQFQMALRRARRTFASCAVLFLFASMASAISSNYMGFFLSGGATTKTVRYGDTAIMTPLFQYGTGVIKDEGGATAFSNVTSGTGYTTAALSVNHNKTYTLTVTNPAGDAVTAQVGVTVTQIVVDAIAPASPKVTAGSTTNFVSSASGGVNNNLTWTAGGGTVNPSIGQWTAPGTPGDYTITATSVADPTKTASTVASVYAAPAATSISSSNITPDYGASFTLTPAYSGGAGVITYSGGGAGSVACPASGGATAPQTANWGGGVARTYTLTVTNPAGATDTKTVTVTPKVVSVGIPTPSASTKTVSTSTVFSAAVTGGSLGTVTWSSTAGTWSGNTWTAPSSPQSNITITAISVDDTSKSNSTTVTVVAAPTTPLVSIPAFVTASQGGYTASINTQAGCTYSWTLSGGSITAGQGTNSITFTAPATVGAMSATATVTNSASTQASGIGNSTVIAAPVATSLVPSTANPLYGASFTLTPNYSNGTGSIDYGITCPATGVASAAITANWGQGSGRTYTLSVTNVAGSSATPVTTTVTPQTVSVASVTPANSSKTVNTTGIVFTSSVSGAANAGITWTVSSGSITAGQGSNSMTWTAPSSPSTVTITATSQADGTKSASTSVYVVAAPSGSISASTASPLYGATNVTVTPSFAAGAGKVGTTQGGSEVSANPTSGAAIGVQMGGFTATQRYWLRVTNAANDLVDPYVDISPQTVGISAVLPASVNLTVGYTQTFGATVSGAVNTTVNWSVDGVSGGNASVGTISAAGLYTAGTATGAHTIKATAAANGTTNSTATATVYAPPVASSITTSNASPATGGSFTLTPSYSNGTGSINYSVSCPATGVPSAAQAANWGGGAKRTYTLTVTNIPGQTDVKSVDVTPQTVSVGTPSPAGTTKTVGQSQAYTATVTGGATNAVTWSANGGSWAGSTWSATSGPGTFTITATSTDDVTKAASTTVTVVAAPNATSLTPSTTSPLYGATFTLMPNFSGGTGSVDQSVGPVTSGVATSPITANWAGSRNYTLTVTNITPSTATVSSGNVTPQTPSLSAVSPSSTNLTVGYAQTFSATVGGAVNASVSWFVDNIAGGNASVGTISAGGYYVAGTATGSHTIKAVAAVNGVNSTATVGVYASPVANSLSTSDACPIAGSTFTLTPSYANGTASISYGVTCPATGEASAALAADWGSNVSRTYTLTVTNVPGQVATASVAVTPQSPPPTYSGASEDGRLNTGGDCSDFWSSSYTYSIFLIVTGDWERAELTDTNGGVHSLGPNSGEIALGQHTEGRYDGGGDCQGPFGWFYTYPAGDWTLRALKNGQYRDWPVMVSGY